LTAGLAVGFVIGAAVAAVVVVLLHRLRSGEQLLSHERALDAARSQVTLLESQLDNERRLASERQMAWDEARAALSGEFASLSSTALRASNEQFLQLADGRFELAQQRAKGELDHTTQSIEQLLSPIREQLGRYEDGIRHMERERQHAYSTLVEQVKQLSESQDLLQRETRNLVTALRAPATRGRWGEQQLRRLMELAGMIEHCDFEEQVTQNTDTGRVRPDVIVRLTGGRKFIVDAKVPLQAFLDAIDSTDDAMRRTHMVGHARQLRAHVDSLAKKAYWEQFDFTPEYVIAFIPGDPLLAAALEHDPTLLDHAFEQRVVLATPTSLIALLRTVAFGWQQESLAQNAIEVQKAGSTLYKRLSVFGEHLAKAGRHLGGAVESYNKAVGSLERNVLPQAKRFHDLGVGSSERQMPQPEPIDSTPRLFQAPELTGSEFSDDDESCDVVEIESPVRMLPAPSGEALRARSR